MDSIKWRIESARHVSLRTEREGCNVQGGRDHALYIEHKRLDETAVIFRKTTGEYVFEGPITEGWISKKGSEDYIAGLFDMWKCLDELPNEYSGRR